MTSRAACRDGPDEARPDPNGVKRLTIVCDNDPHGTGQEHAMALRRKWRDHGKEVLGKKPTKEKDFNDVLIKVRRGASWKTT